MRENGLLFSLFVLLYYVPVVHPLTDALVAGGPGLALHFQKDGEHVIFPEFDFGRDSLTEVTVEMWLQSQSRDTSFTPFSYALASEPQRYIHLSSLPHQT